MNEKDIIDDIINNYIQMEEAIVSQLFFRHEHGSTIGGFREEIWMQLFEQVVPKKFVIEQSVFIIDSDGRVSNEVDLAIFDEIYTPYIFRQGRLKFIPIEAVAAVVECKSTDIKTKNLTEWQTSIENLRTSRDAIARMHSYIATINLNPKPKSTQTGTRPIRILCHMGNSSKKAKEFFDFIIVARKADATKSNRLIIEADQGRKLNSWFSALNHNSDCLEKNLGEEDFYEEDTTDSTTGRVKKKTNYCLEDYRVKKAGREVSLLSFTLQFNQLLMLINNPMLFPHKAYADLFNGKNPLLADDGEKSAT